MLGAIVLFQSFRFAAEMPAIVAGRSEGGGLSLHVFPPGASSFVVENVLEWQGSDDAIATAGHEHRELDRLRDEARAAGETLPEAELQEQLMTGPSQSWRYADRSGGDARAHSDTDGSDPA